MIEGQEGVTWQDWCALADACEEHGVETLFRSDHYISQGDEAHNVAHDAWTTIAALAARTSTLRFGTLVSPATFRAPALLANAAATADHVSGGRIELGLGAGWMEREHRAYGFPFPETQRAGRDARRAGRDRPPALDGGARRLPRPPLHARGRARRSRSRCSSRGRRCSSAAAAGAAPSSRRSVRGRVQHAVRLARGGSGDAREKTRPLRFSVMTGFLVGETHEEMRERADELYARRPREQSFDDWLAAYSERCVVGSVDEVVARLQRVRARRLRPRDAPAPAPHRPRAGAADRPRARSGAGLAVRRVRDDPAVDEPRHRPPRDLQRRRVRDRRDAARARVHGQLAATTSATSSSTSGRRTSPT